MCTAACRQLAADHQQHARTPTDGAIRGLSKIYYLWGMCSNSNVWLETRTQSSPAIRGHARTSNHHPSKKYLTTTNTLRRRMWQVIASLGPLGT